MTRIGRKRNRINRKLNSEGSNLLNSNVPQIWLLNQILVDQRKNYLVNAMVAVFILGSSNGWPGLRKEWQLNVLHLLGKECIGLYALSKRRKLQDSCGWYCHRKYIFEVVSSIYEFMNTVPSIRKILLGNYLKGGKSNN